MTELFGHVTGGVDDKARHLAGLRHQRAGAFYVGDTEYDVRSALSAGFAAVAVTGGYRPAEVLERAGADVVVGSLRELLDLVERRGSPIRACGCRRGREAASAQRSGSERWRAVVEGRL